VIMKISVKIGFIFGILTGLMNVFIAVMNSGKIEGIWHVIGIIFFNSYFAILFTKKNMGYQISFQEGFKAAVQAGIIQGMLYFISLVAIQRFIKPDFIPDFQSFFDYLLTFNSNIILFSIVSAILGAILSALLSSHKSTS